MSAPSGANSSAMAWPIPESAPVMSAILPSSLRIEALRISCPRDAERAKYISRDRSHTVEPTRSGVNRATLVRTARRIEGAQEPMAPPAVV